MEKLSPPSRLNLMRESLFWVNMLSLPAAYLTPAAKKSEREPVIVLPGLGVGDRTMAPLRHFLKRHNYDAQGWGLGINLGGRGQMDSLSQLSPLWEVDRDRPHNGEGEVPYLCDRMTEIVKARSEALGRPIALVGWSLGGYVARETARDLPDHVSKVITMGSPVFGGPKYTSAARLYKDRNFDLDWLEDEVRKRFKTPITQPITAIYSNRDGVVGRQAAIDTLSPDVTHIEVNCAHIAMGLNRRVWGLVLEALARG